jgi:hypothetical protein
VGHEGEDIRRTFPSAQFDNKAGGTPCTNRILDPASQITGRTSADLLQNLPPVTIELHPRMANPGEITVMSSSNTISPHVRRTAHPRRMKSDLSHSSIVIGPGYVVEITKMLGRSEQRMYCCEFAASGGIILMVCEPKTGKP